MTKKTTHFGPDLGPLVPSSSYDVFSKNLLHQFLDLMVCYHHVKSHKKTNDLTLRKLSGVQTGRRTDRRTDRQTDESDFIGLCPTNVERPTGRTELLTFYKKTFMLSIYFYHIYFQAEFLQHVQELTPIHPTCLNRHTSSLSGLYYFILLCDTLYICIIIETHG